MACHQLDGAFAQVEHCGAQLLKGTCSRRGAEDGLGVLEAGVTTERDIQKAEHGEQADHDFNQPFAETTKAEHGAMVEGSCKN